MTDILEPYTHKDIDQMNGSQLFTYGVVVTHAALQILREVEGGTMARNKLIDQLVTGALGPSEIAFGLMIGVNEGLLEKFEMGSKTFIRMVNDEE